MARTIYDKPTRMLLKDMLNDMGLRPGQVFTTSRAIEWFKQPDPKLQPGSTATGVLALRSRNDASATVDRLQVCSDEQLPVVVVGGGFIGLEVATTARQIR